MLGDKGRQIERTKSQTGNHGFEEKKERRKIESKGWKVFLPLRQLPERFSSLMETAPVESRSFDPRNSDASSNCRLFPADISAISCRFVRDLFSVGWLFYVRFVAVRERERERERERDRQTDRQTDRQRMSVRSRRLRVACTGGYALYIRKRVWLSK